MSSVAVDTNPPQDGTITYYPIFSSVTFGRDLRQRAIAALRHAWQRGHWHPRFGLTDAINDEISQAFPPSATVTPPTTTVILRNTGPWVQRSLFAIDQGPMLLHLANARSGLIWQLTARNPNLQRAIQKLSSLSASRQITLEGEAGFGPGPIMARSNASHKQTRWLHAGEALTFSLTLTASAQYQFAIRYSNDNSGPLETISLTLDGQPPISFTAEDTGDDGQGWNNFLINRLLNTADLQAGPHHITISVAGGDTFGVEIDSIYLDSNTGCFAYLPTAIK